MHLFRILGFIPCVLLLASCTATSNKVTMAPFGKTAEGDAVELGPKGITCNAISPGFFHTGLGGAFTEGEPPTEETMPFYKMTTERTPVGRWANPKDIGGIGVFLASDAASFVNGQTLTVDGGHSVRM